MDYFLENTIHGEEVTENPKFLNENRLKYKANNDTKAKLNWNQNFLGSQFLIEDILQRIRFFNKPDIIPYPYSNPYDEPFSYEEPRQAKVKDSTIKFETFKDSKEFQNKRNKNSNKITSGPAKTEENEQYKREESPNPRSQKFYSDKNSLHSRNHSSSSIKNSQSTKNTNRANKNSYTNSKSYRQSSRLFQTQKNFEDLGVECEKCVRLHRHSWAKSSKKF